MKDSCPWTPEEDGILLQALALREEVSDTQRAVCRLTVPYVEEVNINWIEVASFLHGRNNKDCRKRWVYSLSPSIRKGTWTKQEDSLLREGVHRYGTRLVLGKT